MEQVHVGRQPIFDRSLDVLGYELLFRASAGALEATDQGDFATSQVIVNTFTEFGLDSLVGPRLAFVNVTRSFVVGDMPIPVAAEGVVLELLETIPYDREVVAGVERLRADGFTLALDDFVPDDPRTPLLEHCSYVKVDVHAVTGEELRRALEQCAAYDVKLVAERIDSLEEMGRCVELGFDFFQGYHLLRPDVVTAAGISPSQLTCLELMSRLGEPDVTLHDIEEVVRTDVGLNYRLLRAVNAAHAGSKRHVSSIREAIVFIGLQRLRSWLLLLTVANADQANETTLSAALTRARTCELLAGELEDVSPDSAFVAGLLSGLDTMLGLPMGDVVARLPLAPEIELALLHGGGRLSELLDGVLAYEDGDPEVLASLHLDAFEVSRAYLAAVAWSLQVCASALAPEAAESA